MEELGRTTVYRLRRVHGTSRSYREEATGIYFRQDKLPYSVGTFYFTEDSAERARQNVDYPDEWEIVPFEIRELE